MEFGLGYPGQQRRANHGANPLHYRKGTRMSLMRAVTNARGGTESHAKLGREMAPVCLFEQLAFKDYQTKARKETGRLCSRKEVHNIR